MPVTVRAVRSRRDRRLFINLPWQLYRNDPCWVPPLKASVRDLLDPARHPFYDRGKAAEIELLLAFDNGRPVGRIAAILNHAYNRFHSQQVACFGFFECSNEPAVAQALLSAVEQWAAEHNATAVLGPLSPSTNYECGLLIEGFDRPPALMMSYNPPYYEQLIEQAGYLKAKDLYAYYSPVHGKSLDRLRRLADAARSRVDGLHSRPADLRRFAAEVKNVQEIYNSAWQRHWGFVPLNDAEIEVMAKELRPLVQPELVRFCFINDEPVGFILALPDWNLVLKELDGSPLRHPLRALKHLLFTRPESLPWLRVVTLGVKEAYRKRGCEAVLLAEAIEQAVRLGYQWGEYSWILEDNELSKRTIRLMHGERYKVYRLYERSLPSGS